MSQQIQYIREKRGSRKGQLRGVVIAEVSDTRIGPFGWSQANTSLEPFDKEDGLQIARDRLALARRGVVRKNGPTVPHEAIKIMASMVANFKTATQRVALKRKAQRPAAITQKELITGILKTGVRKGASLDKYKLTSAPR
jgi:hypothetical protein